MNKLLYVNIGGVVFQIDEAAYKKLDTYLESIRRKYNSTADGEEIIKDIENRIAELFLAKVGERGAITENYVDEVIDVMGKPEDYEEQSSAGPKQQYEYHEKTNRATKFFRDKDNNVLGGVCSGFAAKFDIDALWIRLAFVLAFLFAGTGLLLYIILWIIIPEAKTTAEKLEMRGEKVDINNIERTIKDGAKQFSTKMNEFGEEVKQTFNKEHIDRTKKNAGDFIESAVETLKPAVLTIARIFAFALLIVSLVIVVVLTIELTANWGEGFTQIEFFGNHITDGGSQAWILVTCALGLIIIPLIGLIFSSIKFLTGVKKKTKWVSGTLGVLWTGCLIAVIYLGIMIGRDFKYEGTTSSKMQMVQPQGNILYVHLNGDAGEHVNWSKHGPDNWHGVMHTDSSFLRQISIEVEKSVDTNYTVFINKSARGYDRINAKENAENFDFMVEQTGDSIVIIPASIDLKDNEKFRGQSVEILIRVPADKYIQLDKNIDEYFHDNEFTSGLKNIELYNNKLKMTNAGLKADGGM